MKGEKEDRPKALWLAAIASFLWLTVAAIFVAVSEPCDGSASNIFVAHFECRTINEIGDFLAGIFAPPAFMLLFAALHLQGHELREQRREIRLTRSEHEATRKAAEEQARVAKETADFIAKQTKLLETQEDRRRREEADELLDERANSMLSKMAKGRLPRSISYRKRDGVSVMSDAISLGMETDPLEKRMYEFSLSATRILTDIIEVSRTGAVLIGDREEWQELRAQLVRINSMESLLSPPHRDRMNSWELKNLISLLGQTNNKIPRPKKK